ncbi:MAG: hypothetical protein AAFX98_04510, partial [Pseudomonadota bacterium]
MKQSIWRHTLLGLSFIAGSTLPATAQEPDPIVASYYSSTGSPDKVAAIPAEKLSHVLYAFLTLCGDHRTAGEIAAARVTKACQGKPDFT